MPQPAWTPERLAARLPFLRRRALLTQAVRAFFLARGYVEVETPYAVRAPGEEVHLSPFATERVSPTGDREKLWLHTSPEFAMKKLLAGGAGRIFQIARVWRNGEGSDLHAPEFTMLEWYCPGADMPALIAETFLLLRSVLPPVVRCRGVSTDLAACETLTMADAFFRLCRRRPAGDRGRRACAGRRRRRDAAARGNLGGSFLSAAAGTDRAEHRQVAPDVPDALAGSAGSAGPPRPG